MVPSKNVPQSEDPAQLLLSSGTWRSCLRSLNTVVHTGKYTHTHRQTQTHHHIRTQRCAHKAWTQPTTRIPGLATTWPQFRLGNSGVAHQLYYSSTFKIGQFGYPGVPGADRECLIIPTHCSCNNGKPEITEWPREVGLHHHASKFGHPPVWVTPPWVISHSVGLQSLPTLGTCCQWRTPGLSRQLHVALLEDVLFPATCGTAMEMYLSDRSPSPLSSDTQQVTLKSYPWCLTPHGLAMSCFSPQSIEQEVFGVQLLSYVLGTSLKEEPSLQALHCGNPVLFHRC